MESEVHTALTGLEASVLRKLTAGDHPVLSALRRQVRQARVVERDMTGVGFYTSFRVEPMPVPAGLDTYVVEDVLAELEALDHGAGFILYVVDGVMNMLEAFTYGERWPSDVRSFTLRYFQESRELLIPRDVTATESSPVVVLPEGDSA